MSRPEPWKVDLASQSADYFLATKQRMPKDFYELRDWLVEYGHHLTERNRLLVEAYERHMESCNRPVLLPEGFLNE